jgi:hypothetical protein
MQKGELASNIEVNKALNKNNRVYVSAEPANESGGIGQGIWMGSMGR